MNSSFSPQRARIHERNTERKRYKRNYSGGALCAVGYELPKPGDNRRDEQKNA